MRILLTNYDGYLASRIRMVFVAVKEAWHVVVRGESGYNSHLLVTERTISINTTATGGNVNLMSINDVV
ncbi:MAG: hypothetical protein EKK57_01185 [Proteobacteria bacterium]|nr:MAG: hypothetical protein EKK57_01185 [Pseudomonadota bacterium]